MADAVEALLVAALDDPEESNTSKTFPETRVCDSAAHVLSQLHAKKYVFGRRGGRWVERPQQDELRLPNCRYAVKMLSHCLWTASSK